MDGAGNAASKRWAYRTTWMRAEGGDETHVQKHLDEYAGAGWELVSANAVQLLSVSTGYGGTGSSSVMRHYFYWRRAT